MIQLICNSPSLKDILPRMLMSWRMPPTTNFKTSLQDLMRALPPKHYFVTSCCSKLCLILNFLADVSDIFIFFLVFRGREGAEESEAKSMGYFLFGNKGGGGRASEEVRRGGAHRGWEGVAGRGQAPPSYGSGRCGFGVFGAQDSVLRDRCSAGTRHAFLSTTSLSI